MSYNTQTDRSELAKMVMALFSHWQLSSHNQLALLGLSPTNRSALTRYRQGKPLALNRDLQDRVGILLDIHKTLRLLFPHNREMAYTWMTIRNKAFEGMTPVELIDAKGFYGLLVVQTYLQRQCN